MSSSVVIGSDTAFRPAVRLPASEVRPGDVLLLDGHVSTVGTVVRLYLTGTTEREWATLTEQWYALHIQGSYNIIRFPHETVSVIRSRKDDPP